MLPEDIIITQQTLEAKRKLTRILWSKSPNQNALSVGDLIEDSIKYGNLNGADGLHPEQY